LTATEFLENFLDMSGRTESLRAKFTEAIRSSELAEHEQYLLSILRPVLRLYRTEGPPRTGQSKFGGCPDLPLQYDWPAHTGGPYEFVAQLNFAELQGGELGLPREGVLFLFAATQPAEHVFWGDPGYAVGRFHPSERFASAAIMMRALEPLAPRLTGLQVNASPPASSQADVQQTHVQQTYVQPTRLGHRPQANTHPNPPTMQAGPIGGGLNGAPAARAPSPSATLGILIFVGVFGNEKQPSGQVIQQLPLWRDCCSCSIVVSEGDTNMNIAIFGTGVVGQTMAKALTAKGHNVSIGTRDPAASKTREDKGHYGDSFASFHQKHPAIPVLTYADAADFGDVIVNCTSGMGTLSALDLAGEAKLADKLLLDIANPLDFSKGMPPTLFVCNDDSLGEQIQRKFPKLKVVKTLNTMNCEVMVDPARIKADHTVFVSGNDDAAKARTKTFLSEWFGWKTANIIDLGDITTARGTEQLLPIWIRLWGALKTGDFNFQIAR
jgi:8-hydroxy-5-deazaflavin:NADPH oxidoreductase